MADPSRRGKQKRKQVLKDELEKPTKEEYAVAKCLRFHDSLNREGKFLGNNVPFFVGSKAVDILMDSKWSSKHDKSTALFTSRSSCELYCERLLEKGFFHRAMKYEKRSDRKRRMLKEGAEKKGVKEDTAKKGDKKSKKEKDDTEEREKDVEQKDEKETKSSDEKSEKTKEDSTEAEDRKRKKKKPQLDMHDQQLFLDGPDLYVWIYDPVPPKTFIIGLLLVFGSIAVCLFPLWPPEVRIGVYYLSVAAASFIGVIFILCIIRLVVFAIAWLLTWGKLSFWLLPNLTEDVGFFDSFRPVYECTFAGPAESIEEGTTPGGGGDDKNAELAEAAGGHEEEKTAENDVEQLKAAGEENENIQDIPAEDDDNIENSSNGDDDGAEKDEDQLSAGAADNGYEMISAKDVENGGDHDDEEGIEESKPTAVRRRKGKRRIT